MKNNPITFALHQEEKYVVVAFDLTTPNHLLVPADLSTLVPPDPIAHNFAHKGVILSGKGPIWLYGFLVHFYHPTRWVATYDPRWQGGIVVETHDPSIKVGTVIPVATTIFSTTKKKLS
ncbi:MAG: CRISPR-associated ring nuclease Crn3/Csx3 [Bacteroidota bacterium]